MNLQLLLVMAAVLGILTALVRIEMRRDVARFPALKRLKRWQAFALYLLAWIAISWIAGLWS